MKKVRTFGMQCIIATDMVWYGEGIPCRLTPFRFENSYHNLPNLNAVVAASNGMLTVKLCSNKINL